MLKISILRLRMGTFFHLYCLFSLSLLFVSASSRFLTLVYHSLSLQMPRSTSFELGMLFGEQNNMAWEVSLRCLMKPQVSILLEVVYYKSFTTMEPILANEYLCNLRRKCTRIINTTKDRFKNYAIGTRTIDLSLANNSGVCMTSITIAIAWMECPESMSSLLPSPSLPLSRKMVQKHALAMQGSTQTQNQYLRVREMATVQD